MSEVNKQVYAARQVESLLGIVKWLTIAVLGLGGVLTGLYLIGTDDGALLGVLVLVVTTVNALLTWALFGWLQHILGVLTVIAVNTAPPQYDPGPPVPAQYSMNPPAPMFTPQGPMR